MKIKIQHIKTVDFTLELSTELRGEPWCAGP